LNFIFSHDHATLPDRHHEIRFEFILPEYLSSIYDDTQPHLAR